jgi:putative transposase
MKYNPEIHHRRSIRLAGWDYSQPGAYFVTIVTHDRKSIFGRIDEVGAGSKPAPFAMKLSPEGRIVWETWFDLPNHITNIELGEFILMPNHVHFIIWILGLRLARAGAGLEPAPTGAQTPLPEIVRQFKTFSARRINEMHGTPGQPIWQRNYYEHIIRDDEDYDRIAEYILGNPLSWEHDDLFTPQTVTSL